MRCERLRQSVRKDLLAESRKQSATKLLRQIPSIGPIRTALLIALIQTPHRFRTKRQLWTYSGLAVETRDSAQYRATCPTSCSRAVGYSATMRTPFTSTTAPRTALSAWPRRV